MTLAMFWQIIEKFRVDEDDDTAMQAEQVCTRLSRMDPLDILDFQCHLTNCLDRSHRWDLWAVAYIINGGCTVEGFENFRGWLICQGREYFEAALREPLRAADRTVPDLTEYECEEILHVARLAYEEASHRPMPEAPQARCEPVGTRWTDDHLEHLYPALFERFLA